MAKYGCRKCGVSLHDGFSTQDANESTRKKTPQPTDASQSAVKTLMIRCAKCGTLNTFVVPK